MAAEPVEVVNARGRKGALAIIITVLVVVALASGFYFRKNSINSVAQAALAGETDAKTEIYRRSWFGGNEIVFNIESVDGKMSAVGMTRRLLKVAEALKNQQFGKVYLAYKGQEKFYFEGAYFKQLGEEREWQNPVYTIRTMPENVYKRDGSPAFGGWSGGLIGVIGGQMEDNNKFHSEWWISDAIATLSQ